jgi:hypothetical protein
MCSKQARQGEAIHRMFPKPETVFWGEYNDDIIHGKEVAHNERLA